MSEEPRVDFARRRLLVALDQLDVRAGPLDLRHEIRHAAALAVVGTVDGQADRGLRGHGGDDLQVGHEPDVVEREDVGRIGHRQHQRIALAVDRQDLVLARDLLWDELEHVGVDV